MVGVSDLPIMRCWTRLPACSPPQPKTASSPVEALQTIFDSVEERVDNGGAPEALSLARAQSA